jgi:polar amino acid transport system substrate-binding protein
MAIKTKISPRHLGWLAIIAACSLILISALPDGSTTAVQPNFMPDKKRPVLSDSTPTYSPDIAPDLDRIRKRGKLIVAMYFEDVAPFFMHNKNGDLVGIDVELAQDIAAQLGVAVEFDRSPQTFDAVVELVANHKADVAISLLSDTLNRAMQVRFTNAYAVLRQTLLVNRLALAQRFPIAETQDDIRIALNQPGVTIGVIAGTSYVDFVQQDYPLATHILYDDFTSMVNDVTDGKLFSLLYDELEIKNWRYEHPDGGLLLRIVVLDNRKDTLAFAVHRDDPQLLAWLNLYLRKVQEDGTLPNLLHTYLDQNDWRLQ